MVYRVLADGIDIYGSDTESSLLSPSLETELNSAGSLEFTLPPDHPSYDDISLMQTEIDVYEDDNLIFFGRPAEVGIDWNKQKKVVCEGALAYLNDAAIRPHKFEGVLISDVFKYIIAQYNAQVAQNKQFIVGNITITDRYVYTEFDYDICLSVLISTCIDSTGGYLFLRKEENGIYIDWLAEVPDASDQPVQFASNMLDLNQDTKAEDICTVVLPVGGQVDGVNITIAPVNQGSDILEDSDAIAKYGRILKIQQWNDIIDSQALKDKATEWLAKQQEDDITIETDAAELHYLDGSVGAYRIGQLVNVISGPHGVDKEYPILKMSMNLDSGTKRITLGTPPRKELTELSGITNSTGGGSSSGGGGGGGSTGVTDVLVNGSSVVSEHVARISAVTPQQLNDGLATKANQSDLNALSTVVAGKASQADLNALSNTVSGKQDQLTPGTGISIDANNVISATGGGGTDVEANPSEPATDDLNTIKIGETVYDIPGGGGKNYGKFTCDVLFDTPTSSSGWDNPITICTKSVVEKYDALVLTFGVTHQETATILVADLLSNQNGKYYYLPTTNANGSNFHVSGLQIKSNNDLLFYVDASGDYLYKVYGLKFENKLINRSDIYSEEERMIGRWTDGKPLYQKTVVIDNPVSTGATTSIVHGIADVETIVDIYGGAYLGSTCIDLNSFGSYNYYTLIYASQTNISYELKWGSSTFTKILATIQYTKTTDTTNSGFLPEDPQMVMMSDYYSEEEQVVGRWTDGKPIYQKTWIFDNWVNFPNNAWTSIVNNVTIPFDYIVTCNGFQEDQAAVEFDMWFDTSSNSLKAKSLRTENETIKGFTLQYTKTTDAPGTGPTKGNLIYLPSLYSEEEREVGVWKDGKPLYQKTWDLGAETLLNGATYISTIDISGMEKILPGKAIGEQYVQSSPIMAYNDNNKLYVVPNVGIYVRYITLQYTKTTDQPGSGTWTPEGQLSHHYSTSEKVVGTWIDGSTVYERTIVIDNPVSTGATTYIAHGISDIETIVDICGGAYLGSTCIGLNSFGSYNYYTLAYADITTFAYELKWGSSTFTKICATLQYTKSS